MVENAQVKEGRIADCISSRYETFYIEKLVALSGTHCHWQSSKNERSCPKSGPGQIKLNSQRHHFWQGELTSLNVAKYRRPLGRHLASHSVGEYPYIKKVVFYGGIWFRFLKSTVCC